MLPQVMVPGEATFIVAMLPGLSRHGRSFTDKDTAIQQKPEQHKITQSNPKEFSFVAVNP